MARNTLILLAVAAALGGCASVARPPEPAPVTGLPAAWSRGTGDAGTGWRGFGDARLQALIDEALAANPSLQAAQANLAQARALRDVAAAGQSVQLGSSASAGRNRAAGAYSTSLRAGLDASWEADLFGSLAYATAAADASAEASAATLQATRLSIAGEVALDYLQWLGLRHQLDLAQQSLASQEETLQLVTWRVMAGLAAELDLQQARASVESTRARLPALQTPITQTENALAVLLGRAPRTLDAQLSGIPAVLPAAPALPAAGLPADVLRQRPDVRAAELQARSAWATLGAREADRLPSFSISGSLGWQAATLSALSGPTAAVAGVAAAVSWPVLDGGAAKARVAAQRAVLDAAEASYRAAVLTALQDVEDNLAALDQGRTRVATLQRAADAADNALALAQWRYQSGLIDFTTLLDTQRTALSAHDTLASARTDWLQVHVRLAKALGGRWPSTTSDPT